MSRASSLGLALLLCLFLIITSATAGNSIISNYNPQSKLVYYNDSNIEAYAARFDIDAPCRIENITVRLAGESAKRAAVLYFYGHEGGTVVPSFQHTLIQPIVIEKSQVGFQEITISLPVPIHIANNQVFVVIKELAEDVVLVSDSKVNESACDAPSTDPVMMQLLQDKKGQWRYGLFTFGIDLDVVYDNGYTKGMEVQGALTDVTKRVGLDDSLECRSIAWADVNRDGWQDVLVGGKLFVNSERGFREQGLALGATELSDFAFFVDVDNDTYSDIVVVYPDTDEVNKPHGTVLYRNSQGVFSAIPLGNIILSAPTCFAIADINNDNYADVFIGQGEDTHGVIQPDILLVNNTQGGFVVHSLFSIEKYSITVGAVWTDYNNDGKPDLYLVKYNGQNDELWHNNGDGTFTNVIGKVVGKYNANRYGYKVGCDWADIDNDGDMDLLQPQEVTPGVQARYKNGGSSLLQNTGAPEYAFHLVPSDISGVEIEEKHAGGTFGDVNNDGLLDILLTTSCKCRYADLYVQREDHTFDLQSFQYGLHTKSAGIDATWVDFNNDGKLDVATRIDGKFALLANGGTYNANYVALDLEGTRSNAQAIGAEVTVYAGSDHYTQYCKSGRGYAMQPPLRLHFGIGKNTRIDSAVVVWPDGHKEVFTDVKVNSATTLSEKSGAVSAGSYTLSVRAYPNPFTVETVFAYDIPREEKVKLEVYTLLGVHIVTLVDDIQVAGAYTIPWNGNDAQHNKLSSGTYLYKLTVGTQQYSGHVTMQE